MLSRRRTAWAWLVLAVLVAPYAAAAVPRCPDDMTDESADMVGRCAGLWAAGCCDFTVPRPRLQDDPDSSGARRHVPVIGPALAALQPRVAPSHDGPPGSEPLLLRAAGTVAGATGTSSVLRL